MQDTHTTTNPDGATKRNLARTDFQLYYNLGAEVDQDEEAENEEEDDRRQQGGNYEERESRSPGTGHRTTTGNAVPGHRTTVNNGEADPWGRGSVPPDLVASAEGLRVVRAEPRLAAAKTKAGDISLAQVHREQLAPTHNSTITATPAGGPTPVDLRRLAMERYAHLEDLLDGEPWDEADLAPSPNRPAATAMDLVVRVGGTPGPDGYLDRSRPRIVQVIQGGDGRRQPMAAADGEERAWLAQCGLTSCSSTCQIM